MANGREKGVMLRDRAFDSGSCGEIGQSKAEETVRPAANCGNNLAELISVVELATTSPRIAPLPRPRPIAMPVRPIPVWTLPRAVMALLRGGRAFAYRTLFGPAVVSESDPYA